ncbi:MAG: hypothetical protein JW951_04275, partial [Lentisphaerae bacterium]|nr:hypothetical protein [Lentisphaerota bacterium]
MPASSHAPGPDPGPFTVPPAADGRALLDFLSRRLGLSRKRTKALIDSRRVWVDERRVWMARHPLRAGNRIEIAPDHAAPAAESVAILYRDDEYVIADKPPGLLSNGPHSLETRIRQQLGLPGLTAVHRLDRDTTGCLLLAVGRKAFEAMIPRFRAGAVGKHYRALAAGCLKDRTRTITRPVN